MAVNDELGITHPSLGDSPDLAFIIDRVIEQLKPLIVAQFATSTARGIAYPDITDAPKVNLVAEELQVWNSELGAHFPIGGGRHWQNSLSANAGVGGGVPAQVPVTFNGPAGQYLVLGTMGIANQASTVQIATGEVRFDGESSGTLPFTMSDTRIETMSRAWSFLTATSGTHTAQVVCTPTAFAANVYHDSSVFVLYLGTLT